MTVWRSAREAARRATFDLLRQLEPGAFALHHRHGVGIEEAKEPTPLAAARAARILGEAADCLVIEHVLAARGRGEAWEEIATALSHQNGDQLDAASAHILALGVGADDPWWSPARGVFWTCTSCEELVRDFGPECGGPDDRETGHAPTCSRHVAEVLAWEAMWA